MPTYNGLRYWEVSPGSPSLTLAPRAESRAQVTLRTVWDDVVNQRAGSALLGFCVVADDWPGQLGKKFVSRSGWADNPGRGARPLEHPDWPFGLYLADSMKAEGFIPAEPAISADDTAAFDKATLTLDFVSHKGGYRHLDDEDVLGNAAAGDAPIPQEFYLNRCCEITERTVSKAQTIPDLAGLRWESDNRPAETKHFITLYETDITVKIWPYPLTAWREEKVGAVIGFNDLIGTSNSLPFPPTPPAGGVPSRMGQKAAETLVWGQPEKELIRMGNCDLAYAITLKLKWFPKGANSFFRFNKPGGPGWDRLVRPGGATLFPRVDWRVPFYLL